MNHAGGQLKLAINQTKPELITRQGLNENVEESMPTTRPMKILRRPKKTEEPQISEGDLPDRRDFEKSGGSGLGIKSLPQRELDYLKARMRIMGKGAEDELLLGLARNYREAFCSAASDSDDDEPLQYVPDVSGFRRGTKETDDDSLVKLRMDTFTSDDSDNDEPIESVPPIHAQPVEEGEDWGHNVPRSFAPLPASMAGNDNPVPATVPPQFGAPHAHHNTDQHFTRPHHGY